MRKAARTRRTKPFTFSWTTISLTACGQIPTPISICCGDSRPYARRISAHTPISRKPFKSGTITASIGSARTGKATGHGYSDHLLERRKQLEWCFDGEPVGGAVAVSSVGTQLNKRAAELFRLGYDEMLRRLNPSTIYFYRPCAGWRFQGLSFMWRLFRSRLRRGLQNRKRVWYNTWVDVAAVPGAAAARLTQKTSESCDSICRTITA